MLLVVQRKATAANRRETAEEKNKTKLPSKQMWLVAGEVVALRNAPLNQQ